MAVKCTVYCTVQYVTSVSMMTGGREEQRNINGWGSLKNIMVPGNNALHDKKRYRMGALCRWKCTQNYAHAPSASDYNFFKLLKSENLNIPKFTSHPQMFFFADWDESGWSSLQLQLFIWKKQTELFTARKKRSQLT